MSETIFPHTNTSSQTQSCIITLELIQAIEWRHFEMLCAEYFKAKGYQVRAAESGKDGGVDITLYQPDANPAELGYQKPIGYVQCKSWQSQQVGVKVVRELYGVMAAQNVEKGFVMAAGSFSDDALAFAKGKQLQLIDGLSLVSLLRELADDQRCAILAVVTTGDYLTPSCPSCGIKLVRRESSSGANKGSAFWGCRNFPRCRYTLKVKNTVSPLGREAQIFSGHASNEHRFPVSKRRHKEKGAGVKFFGLVLSMVFIFFVGSMMVNMFKTIATQSIAKSQQLKAASLEKLSTNSGQHSTLTTQAVPNTRAVSDQSFEAQLKQQQAIEQHRILMANTEKKNREREVAARFDAEYKPAPECINPADSMFVRCVDARRQAKMKYYEAEGLSF